MRKPLPESFLSTMISASKKCSPSKSSWPSEKLSKSASESAGMRRDYLKQAESGESRLWLLLKGEEPFALLKIDVKENEEVVGQFSAHDNDDPEISFELAMKILRELGVTADNETSFARVGAFGRFKGGRPEVEPVRVGEQEMWIWLYEDELIVGMEETQRRETLLVPLRTQAEYI